MLVSGSSRGIGLAIAQRFLEEEASVCLSGRDAPVLEQATQALAARCGAGRLMAVHADLTTTAGICEAVRRVRERWNRLDVLVANIGSGRGTAFEATDAAAWQTAFQENLFGHAMLVKEALPLLKAQRGRSICFIGSIAGLEALPAPVPYAAAKAGLVATGKMLSRELAPHQIRVNVVAPGNIVVAGGTWDRKQQQDPREVASYLDTAVPLRRFGTPEEVADCVVFLSSTRASFVTGACWIIEGGHTTSF